MNGNSARLSFLTAAALVFCSTVPSPAAARALSFIGAWSDFRAGYNARSVVSGDFNGDGRDDLAVANQASGTLSVLLGDGDGTFQPPLTFTAGGSPVSVAVGDFNGDGKPDLAVANYDSDDVSVLLGNGDGTFQAAQTFAVGHNPGSVAVGDFNADGKLDLAVANTNVYSTSSTVSVLLGNGDGTFQPPLSFAAGAIPLSVAVGDFNGDGVLDMAVANMGQSPDFVSGVWVLLGNGDGTFQAALTFPVGRYLYSVAVGDFNGDGKLDLAVADYEYDSVSVLLGNGDGTFQPTLTFAAGDAPSSVAVSDVNGDGRLDLVVTNLGPYAASVLLGNGDGSFRAPLTSAAGTSPSSVAVGDFNGDGLKDLAVANSGEATVTIRLGNGDGTFQAAPTFPAGRSPRAVATGDFNGDGALDLAVASEGDGTVSVLLGNGDGTFGPTLTFAAGDRPVSVVVGDFNGDGEPDLVVANYSAKTVSVLLGNGDGSFQPPVPSASGGTFPQSVAAADFNGDGKLDLAVANISASFSCPGAGVLSVLLGNGDGTFQPPLTIRVGGCLRFVAVGDFNGDGVPDLVSAYGGPHGQGGVVVDLGNGDGTFRRAWGIAPGYYSVVAVGDFDDDGVLDLALGVVNNCQPLPCRNLYLGNGDGTFRGVGLFPGGDIRDSIAVGDFNDDGMQDLVVTHARSNTVSVSLGNGDGSFKEHLFFGVDLEPVSVVAGEFNGDHKLDLAVANTGSNDVSVLIADTGKIDVLGVALPECLFGICVP